MGYIFKCEETKEYVISGCFSVSDRTAEQDNFRADGLEDSSEIDETRKPASWRDQKFLLSQTNTASSVCLFCKDDFT